MGGLDTYLFYPPREPINRNLPGPVRAWWQVFGNDLARAFDAYGWSYYTREWAEYWYPGYSDSWGSLSGAVGILYEQAGLGGQPLRRRAGEIQTYRESAHHQAVASLANLETLAKNREAVLREYGEGQARQLRREGRRQRALVRDRAGPPSGARELPRRDARRSGHRGLRRERGRARARRRVVDGQVRGDQGSARRRDRRARGAADGLAPARVPRVRSAHEQAGADRRAQGARAQGRIAHLRLDRLNLAHALDLDAYWCTLDATPEQRVTTLSETDGAVVGRAGYGWVVDGESDRAVAFAAHALELGLAVEYAEKPFTAEGRKFARGSLLVRRSENGGTGEAATDAALGKVATASQAARVLAFAVSTARSPDEGPDLGAPRFRLLARPRIGLVSNTPISPDGFGHVWHQIDRELGLPASMLDAQSLGAYDLRRYNVIVVPPSYGISGQIAPIAKDLETWVRSGGTLIAMGSSASALCGKDLGLSSVRKRADVLDKLPEWQFASKREAASRKIEVDEEALWNPKPAAKPEDKPAEDKGGGRQACGRQEEGREVRRCRQARRPRRRASGNVAGALLAAGRDAARRGRHRALDHRRLRRRAAGLLRRLARALLAHAGADRRAFRAGRSLAPGRPAVARGARAHRRQRVPDGRTPRPRPGDPLRRAAGFRGYQKATGRLLSNALVYGPGLGADQPSDW
jgi:hypothetical protein